MKFLNSHMEVIPGTRLYLFHNYTPKVIKGHVTDDGFFETKEGELLDLEYEVSLIEGKYRRLTDNDVEEYYAAADAYMEETGKEYGDWTMSDFYYKKGMVVTVSDDERKNYLYDGWCNLYLRHNNEKPNPANDCHPKVSKLFTC